MFSFYKTSPFIFLRGAVRGVGGPVPSSSRTRRAALLFGVALFALSSFANVDCWWDQSSGGWFCGGEGSAIYVQAPDGGWYDGVVTSNGVGVCTNCLQMSSDDMIQFKMQIAQYFSQFVDDMDYVYTASTSVRDEIYHLQQWIADIPYFGNSSSTFAERTNFIVSVARPYPSFGSINLGQIVDSNYVNFSLTSLYVARWIDSWNTGRNLLVSFSSQYLNSWFNSTDEIQTKSITSRSMVASASHLVELLPTEPCVLSVATNSPSGGGGGNVVTNYGNWCTYDQGDALIAALDKICDWCESAEGYLKSVSNSLHSIDKTVSRSLFSSYSHLPDVETFNLYGGWTNLYFQGSESYPLEGYEPTNVLQRIELLLYGLSIGLNPTNEVSPESVSNRLSSATNSVSSTFNGFAVSNDSFVAEMNTRGSSMLSTFSAFYNSFSSLSGESLTTSTQFIPDTSFSIGENSYTIPFVGPTSAAATANGVVATLRVFSACLWTIIGLWGCFWYWRSFLGRLIVWCRYAFGALRSAVS